MATITNGLPQPYNQPAIPNSMGARGSKGADRTLIGQIFKPEDIAREDWLRDIQKMEYQNEFNANEAQKVRDYEERLANTAYQRAVEDMKKAGINPILGLGVSGAQTPSVGQASGSTTSSKGFVSSDSGILQLLGSIASIVAGIYTSGASNATKLSVAGSNNATRLAVANTTKKTENYNQTWVHNLGSSKRKK